MMNAITYDARSGQLSATRRTKPEPVAPDSVLIKVAYAGVCGTDLHIIQREFPCKDDGPIVLGHEFSGIVEAVGDKVTNVKAGDKVSIDPNSGCEKCVNCHNGNPHFCRAGSLNNTIGIYRDGGWAEYALIPEKQVHRIPAKITLEQAALSEPLSCLSHGFDKFAPLRIGQRILVMGAGIIGNLAIALLHLQGHKNVTVSEPNETRLALVKNLDTDYDLITPQELDRRTSTDCDYLFDVIIDCSGHAPAIERALTYLNVGGKLCLFGVASPEAIVKIHPYEMFRSELTIVGVKINPYSFVNAINLIQSMGDRYLSYERLGIKTFELHQYNEALELLKRGQIAKAMFKF